MNICAFRNFVASDLDLEAAVKAKRESLPHCRAKIDSAQAAWEAELEKACNEETEAEEGGSMRPMLISACKTSATRARIAFVKKMKSCPRG
ncbi:lysozyme inhibitor LprI family protein [Xanthomonas tesorieronis]|uniref:lysozyme inhibitor LprI family protein n=1 Tax=Xanthomonas tesorieronis TaxID=3160839 RepID=UPI00351516E1